MLAALQFPGNILVEKTSVFSILSQVGRASESPGRGHRNRRGGAHQFASGARCGLHHQILKHFKSDIAAQLLRDLKQPQQQYLGFDAFVRMSAGLPRCLLALLQEMYSWAHFYGERPFTEPLSLNAQRAGITHASDWFFEETRAPGRTGTSIRTAMTRLGELLRDVRFSSKPADCSLSTFTLDGTHASETTLKLLEEAENWSMLIRVPGGHHERNRGRVDNKYQVHPMLSPRWDLPLARRGTLALSGAQADALFDKAQAARFDTVKKKLLAPMTAPTFGGAASDAPLLPGIVDE